MTGGFNTWLSRRVWGLIRRCFVWIQTALCLSLMLVIMRGVLNFVFSEERTWDAVRANLRLIFVHAYPSEHFTRVWFSLGIVMVLAGLSVGLAKHCVSISLSRISVWMMVVAATVLAGVLITQPSALRDVEGELLRAADGVTLRQSFQESMASRSVWILAACIIGFAGITLYHMLGQRRLQRTEIPAASFVFALLAVLLASVWIYPWGHFAFVSNDDVEARVALNDYDDCYFNAEDFSGVDASLQTGGYTFKPDCTVAMSTKIPLTVMWVLLVASWVAGSLLRRHPHAERVRMSINLAWLLAPFAICWMVLRNPVIDWSQVFSVDLPLMLAFALAGSVVLLFLTRPGASKPKRVIAAVLLLVALYNWVAAFFGWYDMLQKVRISFLLLALFALVASNFDVVGQRARLVSAWLGMIAVFHILATSVNLPANLGTENVSGNFFGGFILTIFLAIFTLIFSFPLGVILGLARTSSMPIFRTLSTTYIEIFRGVPLITVLFFFSVMMPLFLPNGMDINAIAALVLGYTLFTSAYLAENIRGGLQSVSQGQYEASNALGLKPAQRTLFIILPQALRVSIPPLVGQAISTFKETSLVAIVGSFDMLNVANSLIPAQNRFLGVKMEGLLFVTVIYWIVAFSMSKYSQSLEARLGVGKR